MPDNGTPLIAAPCLHLPKAGLKRNLWQDKVVQHMRVKFVLTMDDVVVEDERIDQVILDWESQMDQTQILEVSHKWITSKNFLTQRMVGLTRVGESSLTIEPLDEAEDA